MDDLSASQEVSGDPLFKRIRSESRHFRRLKASFNVLTLPSLRVRFRVLPGLSTRGSNPMIEWRWGWSWRTRLRPRRRMQRAPRSDLLRGGRMA
eukprot:113588-Hanusia_phi.AAC.1